MKKHTWAWAAGTKIVATVIMFFAVALTAPAATRISTTSGAWTNSATWVGGVVPTNADDVVIQSSHAITLNANRTVNSLTFSNASGASLTLSAGVTNTVTGALSVRNQVSTSVTATLAGAGAINCGSLTIGGQISNLSVDANTSLTNTLSSLNISSNMSIIAVDDSSDDNDPVFSLNSGTVTVGGTLICTEPNGSVVTLTMANGAQSGTLVLNGTNSVSTSGAPTFSFNGTNAMVIYSGASQVVIGTTYHDLTLSGSGTKTNSSVTVNGKLSLQGTAKVTAAPTYGSTATLEYKGSAAQTNGVELTSTLPNLIIDNTAGVRLTNTVSLTGICTIQSGALTSSNNINGPVIVDGTIAPGGSVGKLTTRRQTWDGGGSYNWEMNNAAGAPGTGWDLITTTNGQGVNVTATSGNPFTIKLISLNGSTPGSALNFTNNVMNTWIIATVTNAAFTNFSADKFTIDSSSFSNNLAGGSFSVLVTNTTNLVVKFIPNTATALKFVAQPSSTTAGSTLSAVTVQLKNASNQNVPHSGVSVSLALNGGGSLGGTTTKTTDASGLATFDDLVITSAGTGKTFTASASGLTNDTSSSFDISAAAANKLVLHTASSSSATAGVALAQQPVIWITDTYGNLVNDSSTEVTATRNAGSGTLQGTTTITAASGVAAFTDLAHNIAGDITISFSSNPSFTGVTSGTITINAAAADHLAIATEPSVTATAGVSFSQQPVIRVEDQFGNLRSSDNATIVSAARTTGIGSGSLQGTTSVTVSNGVATFANLSHNVATNITLDFTASVTGATSTSIQVSPAAAHHLAIQAQPSASATAGVAFGQQPVVAIQDQFNNNVSSDNASVVTGTRVDGAGTLQGTTNVTVVNGIATFTDLAHLVATNITIQFTFDSLVSATSDSIAVQAATADHLFFAVQPGAAVSGTPFGTQPVIKTQDAFGNDSTNGLAASLNVTVSASEGTLLGTTTVDAGANAGNGVATFTDLQLNLLSTNEQLTASATGFTNGVSAVFSVTLVTQTINFGSLSGKTYGDASFGVSASASSGLPVSFSVVSGPATVLGTNVTITGAGNVTIRASQAGNSIYSAATNVDQSFTVSPAGLLVSANNKTRAYGAANPTFTATITGYVNGENSGVLSGTPSLTTSADTNSIVGGYDIVAAIGSLSASNYVFSFTNGTLSVTKAGLIVSADNKSRVYGASNPTLTYTVTGFVNGENSGVLGGAAVVSTLADTNSAVGGYDITVALGTLSSANYSFSFTNGTLSVTKAGLLVSADNKSRVYGAINPAFTATITGFVNGETSGVLGGAPSLTTSAATNSPVGDYDIVAALGSLTSANYSFSFTNGTLTVGKATLLVSANNQSRAYGSANPALTYTITGFANGDNSGILGGAPVLSTTADTNSPVGNYDITISAGTLGAANYLFSYTNGILSVAKATLLVAADDKTRVYGAGNPTFTATITGYVSGENSSVLGGAPSLTTTANTNSAVGPYTITAAVGTLSAANYAFSFTNGTLTVTKAGLVVTAGDKARVYGAANPTFTYTVTGFVNGETAAVLGGAPALSTTAITNTPVGSYAITTTAGTLSSGNYSFGFTNGTLTIGKATLTVSADDKARLYGVTNPVLTVTYSGFVNGETASVLSGAPALNTTAVTNSPVGPYAISVAIGTLSATNYAFSFTNGTLTVGKATLLVAANNKTRVYGDVNPTFTYSVTGFVNGENNSVLTGAPSLTTSAGSGSPVGAYGIVAAQGTLAATNYLLSFTNGMLTVTQAIITVTANNTSRAYGAPDPAFTVDYDGFKNSEGFEVLSGFPDVHTTATSTSTVAGGPYPIIPAVGTLSATNYSFVFVNGQLSITKATLTVTADNKIRAFGITNPPLTVTYTGFANSETTNVLSGAPVITTTANQFTGVASSPVAITVTIGTLSAANYSFSFVSGTLTITKAGTANSISTSLNPALPSSNVTFTSTISLSAPGVGTPSGQVQFKSDASTLGAPVTLNGSGIAGFTTSSLTHGSHVITAEYAGDANFFGSTNTLSPNQVINRPPLATNDVLTAYRNVATNVAATVLKANDADPDGDVFNVTSVSALSAQGGTVTLVSGTVTYTPLLNYIGADSFTYVITDSFGATANGTVNVTVLNPTNRISNIQKLGDGNFRLTVEGTPGLTYVMRAVTNVEATNWVSISTNVCGVGGTFTVDDLKATNFVRRFYRSMLP